MMKNPNNAAGEVMTLSGIDGSNPLGFLAALGLLRILNEGAHPDARMRWRQGAVWSPELRGYFSIEGLADVIRADLLEWENAAVLSLSYNKDGERESRDEKTSDNEVKASPATVRDFFDELAQLAAKHRRPDADLAAALVSDVVVARDKKSEKCKPTALHFLSGQQRFLATANDVRDFLAMETDADFSAGITEALLGPWARNGTSKSFSWDPAIQREYALRARDPSGESKDVTVPVAEWLALRGLAAFPCFPKGTRLLSSGVMGSGSRGEFHMVLWAPWCSSRAATSLQQTSPLVMPTARALRQRTARGVCAVWRCPIQRFGKGYGRFLPAEPI